MIFEIPYPPTKRGKAAWNKRFGLNAYYAGKHWSQRKPDDNREWVRKVSHEFWENDSIQVEVRPYGRT